MWRGLGRGPEEPHARGAHAQHGREGGGTGHGRGGTCLPTQKSPRVPAAWAGPSQCAGRALSAARGEGELVRDAAGSLRPLPEPLSSSPLQPREESSRETGTCGVLWGDGALSRNRGPGLSCPEKRWVSRKGRLGPEEPFHAARAKRGMCVLQDEGLAGERPLVRVCGGRAGGMGCGVFTEKPAVACGWQWHSVALERAAHVAAASVAGGVRPSRPDAHLRRLRDFTPGCWAERACSCCVRGDSDLDRHRSVGEPHALPWCQARGPWPGLSPGHPPQPPLVFEGTRRPVFIGTPSEGRCQETGRPPPSLQT